MASIFISDLHLCATRPLIAGVFFDFLRGDARQADALYILGDLFEYWAGDDDHTPFNQQVTTALREYSQGGTPLYFMHGNRDFLIGADFLASTGATLLNDPELIDIEGLPTLLLHGDTLCTDDIKYLAFRKKVRDPIYQQQFLAQTLASRKQIIAGLRAENVEEKQQKSEAIMDVAPRAVEAVMREYGCSRMIHGHTHRPALHHHWVDGTRCERRVLGDWYAAGSYLLCDAAGCRSVTL